MTNHTERFKELLVENFDLHKRAEALIIHFESVFEKSRPSPTYQLRYSFTHFIRALEQNDEKALENSKNHLLRAYYDIVELSLFEIHKEIRSLFKKYSEQVLDNVLCDLYKNTKTFFIDLKSELSEVKKLKRAENPKNPISIDDHIDDYIKVIPVADRLDELQKQAWNYLRAVYAMENELKEEKAKHRLPKILKFWIPIAIPTIVAIVTTIIAIVN